MLKCQNFSMPLTFEDIINELCKNTVWITPKLPCVFICQCFKQCCWSAATTEASSNYFTEILSIAEHKTAWASPVCLVKIRNGPICSSLIRFLPAETAIIFLSLGFSCGPVVLQCPHTQSTAHLERWGTCVTYIPATTMWKNGRKEQGRTAQHEVSQI